MLPFPPIERIVESTVPGEWRGGTLLDYLEKRYDYLSRAQWQEQIANGRIRVNGEAADGARPAAAGDVINFEARDLQEQEVSWEIGVAAETADYIVIDKPPNLPCHPAGRFFNHTLWAWLKQKHGLENIHFVTRLDRETSGLLLIGKNSLFKLCLNFLDLIAITFPELKLGLNVALFRIQIRQRFVQLF